MMIKWLLGMFLLSTILLTGCGSEGGEVGDANDPEMTTDQEQMQDETDPDLNRGQ